MGQKYIYILPVQILWFCQRKVQNRLKCCLFSTTNIFRSWGWEEREMLGEAQRSVQRPSNVPPLEAIKRSEAESVPGDVREREGGREEEVVERRGSSC